jgi:hypothetical protein
MGGAAMTALRRRCRAHGQAGAITGHGMKDVGAILDEYFARTDKIALAAIAKLERGMK